MRRTGLPCLILVLALPAACRPSERDTAERKRLELASREQRLAERLESSAPAEADAPLAHWILPPELNEISGLALTPDGRLLAHDDEYGRIFAIDPRRGVVLKRFAIGERLTRGDFEGITIGNGSIYMVTAAGRLYEFAEGASGERVRFTVHDPQLAGECEFEGVAYDHATESLLLPCKTVGTRALRDHLVIYRWHLKHTEQSRLSTLTVPLERVIGSNPWTTFHTSDITIDPATGDYVLVAAQERALIQITPSGEVVRSVQLPPRHNQAEGIAITSDSILIISDEATSRAAAITLYRWPLSATTTAPAGSL